MKRKICLVFSLLLSLLVTAQNYRPEGRAFVCVNGQNRYTRALYGSSAAYRMETSDRPVFAIVQNRDCRRVLFRINGVRLDEADYCEARYTDGMRSYVVHHKTWGAKATLRLKAVVSLAADRMLWRFRTSGFDGDVQMEVVCEADGRGPVQRLSAAIDEECYVGCDGLSAFIDERGADRFDEAEDAMRRLASQIELNTPDPSLNTLGGALAVLAPREEQPENHLDIDELLWHAWYDADHSYWRKRWPMLKHHLAGEKSSGYGGLVTRSLASNYRANLLAASMATLLGEDGKSYQQEAEAILATMNSRLWLKDKGHWADFQDTAGLRRVHETAAVWSIYAPINCGACTPEQAYRATKYIDQEIRVQPAEVMPTALAYFEAGRAEEGYRLMKTLIVDRMYGGVSPADFGDSVSLSARTLLQGLFGIHPDALEGRCVLRPGFPASWDSASVRTPYIYYRYQRQGNEAVYEVTQHFRQPQHIVLRQNLGQGRYRDIEGTAERHQVIRVKIPVRLPEVRLVDPVVLPPAVPQDEPSPVGKYRKQNISKVLNANVTDIFQDERAASRLSVVPDINDSVFRSLLVKDEFVAMGVPFRTPAVGQNIVLTSLSDHYPDSVSIPVSGSAQRAWLLMAGTTNHAQRYISNGIVVAHYKDGTADTLQLVNPDNWCSIEQHYHADASRVVPVVQPRPYRVSFSTGMVSRDLGKALHRQDADGHELPGGAATMLCMPLHPQKKLVSLTLRTLSNDVVVGLMAVTLQ